MQPLQTDHHLQQQVLGGTKPVKMLQWEKIMKGQVYVTGVKFFTKNLIV